MDKIYYPKLTGSVTFDPGDSSTNLQTILKVINQLCRDDILASVSDRKGIIVWWQPLVVVNKDKKIVYAYIQDDKKGTLSNNDKAKMLVDELKTYCFDVCVPEKNTIAFKYKKDDSDEKEKFLYEKKIKKSLSKILRH